MKNEWTTRQGYEVAKTPSAPGIFRIRSGGYLVRVRIRDPRTGKKIEKARVLPTAKLFEAQRARAELADAARRAALPVSSTMPFAKYAALVMRRKVDSGRLASAATREWWADTLVHLVNAFGTVPVGELTVHDVEEWKSRLAKRIDANELAPSTVNGWLRILRTVLERANVEFRLGINVAKSVDAFDLSTRPTYTDEAPGSLQDRAAEYLRLFEKKYPQHFAMVLLEVVTGLRPSSVRPLRRRGDEADVLWHDGAIRVRRSHSRRQEVMNKTKTGRSQRISLPERVIAVLRDHEALISDPPRSKTSGKGPTWWSPKMADSDLLFPARHGGLRARSCLSKPMRDISRAMGLAFDVTPRMLRRTFKDLARMSGMSDLASKAISDTKPSRCTRTTKRSRPRSSAPSYRRSCRFSTAPPRHKRRRQLDAIGGRAGGRRRAPASPTNR